MEKIYNRQNVEWLEEFDKSEGSFKLNGYVKEFTSLDEVVDELNNAPVDFENDDTRAAAVKGKNQNHPYSPAFFDKSISLIFEKPIKDEKVKTIIDRATFEVNGIIKYKGAENVSKIIFKTDKKIKEQKMKF